MDINNKIISNKASAGEWSLKKNIDHRKFKPNWKIKKLIAFDLLVFVKSVFQTSQIPIAIKRYKIVHTGAKRKPGGFQIGLFMVVNQVLISFEVIEPLIIPIPSQTQIETINFQNEVILLRFIII